MKSQNNILKNSISSGFHKTIPSKDFTDSVMDKIEFSLENKTVFEPLISKKWWKIIGFFSVSIIIISFLFESQDHSLSIFSNFSLPKLETFSIEDYKTSIQLSGFIIIVLIILTLTDLIYRKYKSIG